MPAKAVWMMHADMDAAREATVVKRLVERAMKKHPQLEAMLGMGAKMMGMDIRKDLHDVTVYGLDTDKKHAVMVVHADANQALLEKMVDTAPAAAAADPGFDQVPTFDELEAGVRKGVSTVAAAFLDAPEWRTLADFDAAGFFGSEPAP